MKNTGKIREMVYEYTFYPSGKYKHCLSVFEFYLIKLLSLMKQPSIYGQFHFIRQQPNSKNLIFICFFVKKLKNGKMKIT